MISGDQVRILIGIAWLTLAIALPAVCWLTGKFRPARPPSTGLTDRRRPYRGPRKRHDGKAKLLGQ